MGCRVGNDDSINILEDPWLSKGNDPYVHSTNEGLKHQMVASLMNPSAGMWDTDLLRDMFEERDVNLILSIPINIEEENS